MLDAARRIVSERSFAHAGDALAAFAEWLNELAGDDPGGAAVAIEIPRGAVVETLVERGFHVYAINPKQLDRFRDRHSMAGAKDDRRDTFVLGDSLRTDRDCFRRVRPPGTGGGFEIQIRIPEFPSAIFLELLAPSTCQF